MQFLDWARIAAPETAIRAFARETQLARPDGANFKATHEYVVCQWQEFAIGMSERWCPAVQLVEKQTCDWMRVAAFTLKLVTGVCENRVSLDRSLQALEIGWSLDRQVSVDRNILRMAAFELLYLESIPASATINEAVELAKKYSTAESGRFVNGILGAILNQIEGRTEIGDSCESEEDMLDDVGDSPIDAEEIGSEEELATL